MPAGTILPVEERLLQLFDELAIERAHVGRATPATGKGSQASIPIASHR